MQYKLLLLSMFNDFLLPLLISKKLVFLMHNEHFIIDEYDVDGNRGNNVGAAVTIVALDDLAKGSVIDAVPQRSVRLTRAGQQLVDTYVTILDRYYRNKL